MTQPNTKETWKIGDTLPSNGGWTINDGMIPTRIAARVCHRIGKDPPQRNAGVVYDIHEGYYMAIWRDDEGTIFELTRHV